MVNIANIHTNSEHFGSEKSNKYVIKEKKGLQ